MEESTVSAITGMILLKLAYSVKQIRQKDKTKGLKDFISPIMEALTDGAETTPVDDVLLQDEDKLKKLLEDTIRSRIKGIQGDAAKKKRVKNLQVKRNARTEDELYKADDLMDEVFNEAAKPVLNSKQLSSLAKKLRETIKNVVDAAAGDNAKPEEPHKVCFRPHKVCAKERDPVVHRLSLDSWLDNHKKAIEEQLLKDRKTSGEKHMAVVAIVANGGLGKTTLALSLFQRQISQKDTDFDLRIWVNVPHEFNMRSLVEGIILYTAKKDVQDERPQHTPSERLSLEQPHKENSTLLEIETSAIKDSLCCLEEGELHEKLRKIIDGKRLLLVLDDVWNMDTEMWLHFKKLLSKAVSDGSRIIITTRSKLVGKITASTHKNVHILRHLTERESCDLFQRSAFDLPKPVNSKIVEVAVEIVKRCGGNPSALKTVGEKLKSTNLETKAWSNFRDKEFQKVVNAKVLPSLQLSYNALPLELRQCFAYCSIFPQQSEIDVKNLIHLWMAQGLIFPSSEQRMEDVGYTYVKDLCQISLFEELEVDHENGFVTKCKMPKLVHDLAVLVSGTRLATLKQKEKLEIGTDQRSTQKDKSDIGTHGERTLEDKHDIGNDDETTQKDKSDIVTDERTQQTDKRDICNDEITQKKDKSDMGTDERTQEDKSAIGIDETTEHVSFHFHLDGSRKIRSFFQKKRPRVRTIILPSQLQEETGEGLRSSTFKDIISNCSKLRTLDLHGTGIKVVPQSIDKLKHLRYLDLSQNKSIKSLPDSITKVPNLMTLKLSSCYGLKELPKDMEKLVNLKHLEIDWCYSLTHMPPRLGKLTQLETLSEFVLKRSNGKSRAPTPTVPKCLYRKGIDLESLEELAELNNLRGELKIRNLRNVNVDYSKVANLEAKEHLKSLSLSWELDLDADDQAANDKAQDTLQGLKPNSKLKELALFGYRGDKLSDWILSLTNLVKFSLQNCECKSLQPLTQLTTLKVLILDNMPNLKYISNKSGDHNSDSNPSSSTEFIKKLEEVRFTELPDLEAWWEEGDASLSFPRLSRLMIEDCPKLCSMPLYPNLKEWLVLKNTSLVPFINTTKDKKSVKQTLMNDGSSSTPLGKLQSLCITGDKDMGSGYDQIVWKSLKSLQFLRFDSLPELKNLPDGLQDVVTTLRELEIWHCAIMSLPGYIGKYKQLRRLGLFSCPKLKSLPIRTQFYLETLEIMDCPILLQRCQKETGADWRKIRHIENILLQQQPQDHIRKIREDDALKDNTSLYKYYWDPKYGKKSATIKRTVLK